MEPGTALVAIVGTVFAVGLPVFFTYRYLIRRLEVRQTTQVRGGEDLKRLAETDARIEERLQNLESVVLNVDYELNQRLLRLVEGQSRMLRTPGDPSVLAVVASAPAVPLPLQAGAVVAGRYKIEAEVGRGGMGAVYRAWDNDLGEVVALKVILPHLSADPQIAERFKREVGAARRVTHPNVVRIHDLGQADGQLFLSMEWVAGRRLEDLLDGPQTLALSDARRILLGVCDGLDAAHRAGVIHRDLKPSNILVGEEGTVKIIDFGLALAVGSAGLTATGLIVGTPEYMAPEQVRGGTQDERTDVYALGVVLYRALCGVLPFSGPNPIAVGFAHLTEEPRPPRSVRADIPPEVEEVIRRALAREPRDRFPRVRDLRAALEKAL